MRCKFRRIGQFKKRKKGIYRYATYTDPPPHFGDPSQTLFCLPVFNRATGILKNSFVVLRKTGSVVIRQAQTTTESTEYRIPEGAIGQNDYTTGKSCHGLQQNPLSPHKRELLMSREGACCLRSKPSYKEIKPNTQNK